MLNVVSTDLKRIAKIWLSSVVLYGLRKGRMVLWENVHSPSFFLTDDYISSFFESVACFNNAH